MSNGPPFEGAKQNTIGVIEITNTKSSHHDGQQKPRWNNPRTFNAKTQAQANVGLLGVWEGIRWGWSCKFKLNGLDA
jgi:hypothetical protein